MSKSFFRGFLLFPFLGVQMVYSQHTDSLSSGKSIAADSVKASSGYSSRPGVKPFHYQHLILPSAMITYGVIALENDGLQDLNEEVAKKVWTEHAHKQIHLDNYLQWAPAVAVYGLNLAGIKGKHNGKDRTIIYGVSTVIMSSVVFAVKKISKEMRPDGSNTYSFPSGHTATAFAAAEFMRQEYKDVSPWYGVGAYAAAAVTGYLRMYNNKHWLSDVVAGAGVGIISTDLAYVIYPSLQRMFFRHAVSTIILPTYRDGVAGVAAIHTF